MQRAMPTVLDVPLGGCEPAEMTCSTTGPFGKTWPARMRRRWAVALCLAVFATAGTCLADEKSASETITAAFKELDTDGDNRLTLEEYLKRSGSRAKKERDFRLFDFDGDGRLTRAEFAAIPGTVPAAYRGALPDPFDALLEAAVDAMDETYGEWNRKPALTIPTQQFVIDFLQSMSSDGTRRFDQSLMPMADPDGNGQVTRAEAKRFLEIQLGMRSPRGQRIREPNGRVLKIRHFLRIDANNDNVLDREEFLARWPADNVEEIFERGDRNGDGVISMDEFRHPEWVGYDDPVSFFMRADKNYDGYLDADELEAAAPNFQKILVPTTLSAFDLDGDGKLSLDEYRLSMLGNFIAFWQSVPTDSNRDKLLSFEEFTYNNVSWHLLRRFYFHQLDANGDGKLSQDEFPFKLRPPSTFHFLSADGSEFRLLHLNEDYPSCGSPAVSPDGKLIAFDGYRGGQGLQQSRILLINADGSGFRNLCEGLMPTWSKDGKQLACSRYRGGSGVWIVNSDGSDEKRIDDGWGAQWSPDGKTIAYTRNNGLWAYDVATGEKREVLSRENHPFRYIYYNMNWSPDSRRLVFKTTSQAGGNDLASISMVGDDPDLKVHFSSEQWFEADISWAPDGRRILFALRSEEHRRNLLHELDTESDDPPKIVDGIDEELSFGGVCFTPDGQGIVVVTRE
jgi:TolB protein